jgi:hypothetical protein
MLNWMKKKTNKKKSYQEMKSQLMEERVEYYKNNIIPVLRNIWQNQRLKELLNVDNLAVEKFVEIPSLSTEECVEVLKLTTAMVAKLELTVENLASHVEKAIQAKVDVITAFEKYTALEKGYPEEFHFAQDVYVVEMFEDCYLLLDKIDVTNVVTKETLSGMSDNEMLSCAKQMMAGLHELEGIMAQILALQTIVPLQMLQMQKTLKRYV